jgi:hypothetical protein
VADEDLRAAERALDAAPSDHEAQARYTKASLRAGGRDPRRDPRKDDVVDAPGPGARVRAGRGSSGSWGSKRRGPGSGPMCRVGGRVVVGIWPQVLVAEAVALRWESGSRQATGSALTIPAGTEVDSAPFYSPSRDETDLSVMLPRSEPGGGRDHVYVTVRGRVETMLSPDRAGDYMVEWAPVLYPETADATELLEALQVLERAGLPTAESAALRERLRPRPEATLASATVRLGDAKREHVAAWRRWAARGTVRRVAR